MKKIYFDENEHPRDKYGQFINKNTAELKASQKIELCDKNRRVEENITPQVFAKINIIRDKLNRNGRVETVVYTFDYRYEVEIQNDDNYSYKILRRKKLK